MVGALAGWIAVLEAPSLWGLSILLHWARETDRRLERLEDQVWAGFVK